MHRWKRSEKLKRILKKLFKKDKASYNATLNKINQVINTKDLTHFKNLSNEMKDFKRVHVGSFVLIFKFDKKDDIIWFEDLQHHDTIYKK